MLALVCVLLAERHFNWHAVVSGVDRLLMVCQWFAYESRCDRLGSLELVHKRRRVL